MTTLQSANITVMIRAARKASGKLKRDYGEVEQLQVSTKGPADFVTAADIRSGCRKAIGFGATSPPPEVWVPIVRSCVLRRSASTVQSWQAWHFEEHVVIGVFGVRRTCGHCSMDLRDGEVPNCRQQEWVCLERVIWLV